MYEYYAIKAVQENDKANNYSIRRAVNKIRWTEEHLRKKLERKVRDELNEYSKCVLKLV